MTQDTRKIISRVNNGSTMNQQWVNNGRDFVKTAGDKNGDAKHILMNN